MNVAGISGSLAAVSLLSAGMALVLLALLAVRPSRRRLFEGLAGHQRGLLGAAWLVAAVATAGSLFYSELAGFPPCVLCWYQRIAMYPLILILGVGVVVGDGKAWRYILPLSLTGLAIAVYHVALQHRPALDLGTCTADVPCTLRYVSAFGFVSIPVMAGSAFLLISALALTARGVSRRGP